MTVIYIKLLDVVALTVDLPDYNLWRGQVGSESFFCCAIAAIDNEILKTLYLSVYFRDSGALIR